MQMYMYTCMHNIHVHVHVCLYTIYMYTCNEMRLIIHVYTMDHTMNHTLGQGVIFSESYYYCGAVTVAVSAGICPIVISTSIHGHIVNIYLLIVNTIVRL